jgi:Xaa-Pro aminopeptidase
LHSIPTTAGSTSSSRSLATSSSGAARRPARKKAARSPISFRGFEARTGRAVACLGAALPDVRSDAQLTETVRAALNAIRRQKDEIELERMREAEAATRRGFAAVQPLIRPGVTERALQIEIEAAFFRNGAEALAFDTIIGTGPNSAVLHFAPTSRPAEAGDLVLIDAGGEYRGYASDVTRTYPASGRFTPEQSELHALVERAALAAIATCTARAEFVEATAAIASSLPVTAVAEEAVLFAEVNSQEFARKPARAFRFAANRAIGACSASRVVS